MVELIRENPAKMDDLGYPEFRKPPMPCFNFFGLGWHVLEFAH